MADKSLERQGQRLPWDTLWFVLAAGSVALLFVGIGWWITRKSESLYDSLPDPQLAGFPALGGSKLPLSNNRRTQAAHFQVGARARQIIGHSTLTQRRIRIATDQPVRIGTSPDIAQRPELGTPVAAGNQPLDWGVVGADEQLYAVVAPGGSVANLTVLMQALS